MPDIVRQFDVDAGYLAHLTSAVQFGFIAGTLVFAILGFSDRFSPSNVFFICALVASLANLAVSLENIDLSTLVVCRFLTGFFLAGIYPVGMKIASDYYQQRLGRSLGFLVGALVLGTSFPHLLKSMTATLPWKYVIYSTSSLSALGGLFLFLLVPDGPYRKPGQKFNPGAFLKGFRDKKFRAASFGYFGHMWELYAFWVFVPVILATYKSYHPEASFNISLLSFFIIATGFVSCILSGILSQRLGVKRTATAALALSCACCLVSPLVLLHGTESTLLIFLFFWSTVVIADSPLFSTLVAQNAPDESKGTSLTIVNCIGFSITIISIQLLNLLFTTTNSQYIYVVLAIGPILGLIALIRSRD
jgi:MFS family permease